MNKKEYLSKLKDSLPDLDPSYLEGSLQYYSEMIDDRIEEGLSEEDAVASVCTPEEAAERIRGEAPLTASTKGENLGCEPKKRLGALEITLIILGFPIWGSLLIAAISVLFSFYASLWSVVIALWAVFGAIVGVGVYLTVYSFVAFFNSGIGTGLFCLGSGLTLLGIGLFLFMGCRYLDKGAAYISKLIPRSIIRLFKGRK